MSQDTEYPAYSLSKTSLVNSETGDSSSRYDDRVIEDRPPFYSVSEASKGYARRHVMSVDEPMPAGQSADSRSHAADPGQLIEKLRIEITQLENWLAHQMESRRRSLSLVGTIRSLIATRQSLLNTLLEREKQR